MFVVLLTVAASAWVSLVLTAPFVPAPAAAVLYGVASLVCHQLPERSFHVGAVQLPVCARCLGIYVGAALGSASFVLLAQRHRRSWAWRPVSSPWVLGVAAVPTLVTVALEWVGLWHTSNLSRWLAGMPLGYVCALVVATGLATVDYDQCAPPRSNPPTMLPPHT